MFKSVLTEISSLNKNSKLITYLILSISLVFCFISGNIFVNKSLQTVDTYNLAIELYQTSIMLFLQGITIGILLNIIDKRKH